MVYTLWYMAYSFGSVNKVSQYSFSGGIRYRMRYKLLYILGLWYYHIKRNVNCVNYFGKEREFQKHTTTGPSIIIESESRFAGTDETTDSVDAKMCTVSRSSVTFIHISTIAINLVKYNDYVWWQKRTKTFDIT